MLHRTSDCNNKFLFSELNKFEFVGENDESTVSNISNTI